MEISLIKDSEYEEVSKLIERTVKESSFKYYYPEKTINSVSESLDAEGVKKRSSWTHFYVIKEDDVIVACGAIGAYWGSETESSLFTIFVDPEKQGQGYGRKIIETLEQDEFFKRAKRIEIPASMVAIPFYRKMGYEFKNGDLIYSDGHFALEKFNDNNLEI